MSTIVLVTGANTGLGYEIVRALYHSPKSYTILLGGRSLDKADKAAAAIREEKAATSSEIATVQIDIESDDSINALHALVESKYGKVDVLINNAGA